MCAASCDLRVKFACLVMKKYEDVMCYEQPIINTTLQCETTLQHKYNTEPANGMR